MQYLHHFHYHATQPLLSKVRSFIGKVHTSKEQEVAKLSQPDLPAATRIIFKFIAQAKEINTGTLFLKC